MRILIDIGHPGHVHLFRPFTEEMMKKGHVVFFTCRQKEFEIELLKAFAFDYKCFGRHYKSFSGKIWGLVKFNIQMIFIAVKFKPDIFLSHGSIYAAQVAWILRKPHISFEDTGNREQVRLYMPFTKYVLTSDNFRFDYGVKQIRYKSHHELAYLLPKYYSPNYDFKRKINVSDNDKYVILRFVSWNASHDSRQSGLKKDTKIKLVKILSKKYKVFISSEDTLPKEYNKFKVKFLPEVMHDALYFADLFIGEGTTMAMEAAILGTKSFYVNSLQYSNVADMENYGLLKSFTNDDNLIDDVIKFIQNPGDDNTLKNRRDKMLEDKIDLTAFLVWFIENYPDSVKIMKSNPDYQYRFK